MDLTKVWKLMSLEISGEIFMRVMLLCILWIIWCALHSILINAAVLGRIRSQAPGMTRYYRLLYNGLSLVTLIPLLVMTKRAGGPVIFSWDGYALSLRVIFLIITFLLFRGGAQQYDLQYFLGVKQLRTGKEHLLLSETEEFLETGVFGITRHPWYLGSLFFIWSMLGEYTLSAFLVACILSVYLVIGTMLEERKIVAQYGAQYCRYRQRVSMLFPWKWLAQLRR